MKKKNQLVAVLAAGLLLAPLAVQADYDYQLIDHPGTPDTQVFGINDRGDVVGNGNGLNSFPFVYAAKKGTLTDVAWADGDDTALLGISDSGILVGSVTIDEPFARSGLIRDKQGTYTVFSHPDAVSSTQARGVSNKGLVSGFHDTSTGDIASFIYDPKRDSFTDIVPSLFTLAHGMNSKGDVVGNAFFFNEDDPCPGSPDFIVSYAWLRTANGSVSYFKINGELTRARGINDAGSIVGFVDDAATTKGFKIELDGSPCQSFTIDSSDLLEFPGFDFLFPEGISNSGVIVGIVLDDTNSHGFIATPR